MEIRKIRKESKNAGKPKKNIEPTSEPIYISPNELKIRWRCSRSAVDRYCKIAKFQRFMLGIGENGNVRYLMSDVVKYERERTV
jgi:hypothetical protein